MPHTRAHIRLDTTRDVSNFVSRLNTDGTISKYVLENFDCSYRADARSFLGATYMSSEYGNELYLVNVTDDGKFPLFVDEYRA